jgi:hypothetical protein
MIWGFLNNVLRTDILRVLCLTLSREGVTDIQCLPINKLEGVGAYYLPGWPSPGLTVGKFFFI